MRLSSTGALILTMALTGPGAELRAEDSTSTIQYRPAVVVHGGASSPRSRSHAVARAAGAAWRALEEGASAVEAAVAAALVLEDDPSFNAGTGSNIRLDGQSVQMDAAVMNERGDFGAVAVIERVKNPILAARGVMSSPHLLLSGEGATRFARSLGLPDYDTRVPESLARYRRLLARMRQGTLGQGWEDFDWKKHWNFPKKLDAVLVPSDTIGAVVSDGRGGFAAAVSTGGTSTTLYGRVGDVPIMGAGSFAGPAGAVCATGWGEYIIRQHLSERVYRWLAEGLSPSEAVARGLALFPEEIAIGLIAVSADGTSAASNTSMAWASVEPGRLRQADDPIAR